jgi:peptidoglycan hydrolase-like protein with peptidoglycan-binding domain
MDDMVLKAQKWVNATYAGVSGFSRCTENGQTGWETVYALTRALQHELGITTLSDSFGPATLAKLTALGPIDRDSGNANIRTIVEAGLYCKGYSGGNLDGGFLSGTLPGIRTMLTDMGLPREDRVQPKVFKALLTMDAYVLVPGGRTAVRTCQQWLNGAYFNKTNFFVGPCDGLFSRNVQKALVLAIQYQLGMGDSEVTGFIGPGTRSGLRGAAARVDTGSQDPGPTGWVRLFQSAVAFNDYNPHWDDGGGSYGADLHRVVAAFQRFCNLAETGAGDYPTWMSLLVSTGDPDRAVTGFDCMKPLNATTIQTVKRHGYKLVGRYLNGGTNKVLTNSEIALITDNGLSFFPLYQEFGDALQYFSYQQGRTAGTAADRAARGFGIPYGTVIYFSVDFDALDTEITSAVIPHFQGVRDAIAAAGGQYAIGVYGCRNTCLRLAAAGLTTRSFVSGMSTGYSGNLGFPLPENWAFDQIKNTWLDRGTAGEVEVDNNVVSGRDLGVSSVTRPRDPNDAFFTMLVWLEARAGQWREQGHRDRSAAELVAQVLRERNFRFKFPGSDTTFGELDTGFQDFVNGYPGRPADAPLRDPALLWDCDLDHFGASIGAVIKHGFPDDRGSVNLADLGGWGGDLLSVLGQWAQSGLPVADAYSFALARIATKADDSFLSLGDYLADADACVAGLAARTDTTRPLSEILAALYVSPATARVRLRSFYAQRFGGSTTIARDAAGDMLNPLGGGAQIILFRAGFWTQQFPNTNYPRIEQVPSDAQAGVARAFVDTVVRLAG